MGNRDSRVDAYIARSPQFARPILEHLRETVHAACPSVEETIKWGVPYFMYRGILCSMSASRQHCTFSFWRGELVVGARGRGDDIAGRFSRITDVSDLPSRTVLRRYIHKAMAINESAAKPASGLQRGLRRIPAAPDYFMAAIRRNRQALATFDRFSPGRKRDYVEWVAAAKSEDTRARRLQTAVKWMAQGKPRHWKQMKSWTRKAGRTRPG